MTPKEELRLSEHFVSPQGEGPRTGLLTQFVRFAGCNMRCPGWPCDTQYAIQPSIYRKDSYWRRPEDLAHDVLHHEQQTGAKAVNLTGGEPFQQPDHLLEKFVARIPDRFFVECFSNGSFIYPDWAIDRIRFVMDWKLAGSGEAATMKENRILNIRRLTAKDDVKFVVASFDDLIEARQVWTVFQELPVQFWCGAAWDKFEAADIVEFIKENHLPWKLNVQVHNYVYTPQERGR